MKLQYRAVYSLLLLCATGVGAASSWSFSDGSITIQNKASGSGDGTKHRQAKQAMSLSAGKSLSKALTLDAEESIKIQLTTVNGKKDSKAHQVFLTLRETGSGLEDSYPFTSRETGKSRIELAQKDLPQQFVLSKQPVEAFLVIASFGASKPYKSKAFDLNILSTKDTRPNPSQAPVRYGKREEIHHIFKADPKSPAIITTLVFTLGVVASIVFVVGAWAELGANINHASNALGEAPLSHALFFGSIVAMEGVFVMYYTSWNLFQTLPVAGIVAAVLYVSGSRALTEVQGRRLAGLRGST